MRKIFVSARGVNESYDERVCKTLVCSFGARIGAADEIRYPRYTFFQSPTFLDRLFDLLRRNFRFESQQHNVLDQFNLLAAANLKSRR